MTQGNRWWMGALAVAVAVVAVLPLLPTPGEPQAAIKGSAGLEAPALAVFRTDGAGGTAGQLAPGDPVEPGAKLVVRWTLTEPAVVGVVIDEGKGGGLAWQSPTVLEPGEHQATLAGDDKPAPTARPLSVGLLVSRQPFQPVLYDLDQLCGDASPCSRLDLQVQSGGSPR